MSKKTDYSIGFDPLEWLREDNPPTPENVQPGGGSDNGRHAYDGEGQDASSLISNDESSSAHSDNVSDNAFKSIRFGCEDYGLTISDVSKTYKALGVLLSSESEIHVDYDDDVEIDGAGVQLLVMLHKHATECGKRIVWGDMPGAVRNAIEVMGLQHLFMG